MKPSNWPDSVPYIDTSVAHVGVSALRRWDSSSLRNIAHSFVIHDRNEPLAVLIPYRVFLAMQEANPGSCNAEPTERETMRDANKKYDGWSADFYGEPEDNKR